MKKLFVVVLAVVALALSTPKEVHAAYSSGNALGGGFDVGLAYEGHSITFGNPHITGKFEKIPIMFGLNINIFDNYGNWYGYNYNYQYYNSYDFGIGITGDWWFFNPTFGKLGAATVSLYIGVGAQFSFGFGDPFVFDMAARLPVGLSWRIGSWEMFTEFLVTLHIATVGTSSYTDEDGNHYGYVRFFGSTIKDDDGITSDSDYHWTKTVGFKPVFGVRYWF